MFSLICNHNQENLTKIRWQFNSALNDISEIIYDSQINGSIASGFHDNCNKFSCNIKLLSAETKNSGIYTCILERITHLNEMNVISSKPFTEIELVIRGPKKTAIMANIGDSVVLPCEHNIRNLIRLRWDHVSFHGTRTEYLYDMTSRNSKDKNYEAQCAPNFLSCNLTILHSKKESAGKYICMVGDSLEYEKIHGLDEMTDYIEIDLVIGEMMCNENKVDKMFIGENDCFGIKQDVLNLNCSFGYYGNIYANPPHLEWIEIQKTQSTEIPSTHIYESINGNQVITIKSNLSITYNMVNSTFVCVMVNTSINPCRIPEIKVQYIKNFTERFPSINSNDLHNIKCLANKSRNVQCSYYWVHEIAGAMLESPYAILPVENMNSPGTYTCIAKCSLGETKECIIKALEIEVIHSPQPSSILNICLIILSTVSVLCFVIFTTKCLWSRFQKFTSERRNYNNPQIQMASNGSSNSQSSSSNSIVSNSPSRTHGKIVFNESCMTTNNSISYCVYKNEMANYQSSEMNQLSTSINEHGQDNRGRYSYSPGSTVSAQDKEN